MFLGVLQVFLGVFDSPLDELDIDKDKLAGDYVLEYYPEYKKCTFEYYNCLDNSNLYCRGEVNIYCNNLENRGGLKFSKNEVTEVIFFDDITLEEIFENKINNIQ